MYRLFEWFDLSFLIVIMVIKFVVVIGVGVVGMRCVLFVVKRNCFDDLFRGNYGCSFEVWIVFWLY